MTPMDTNTNEGTYDEGWEEGYEAGQQEGYDEGQSDGREEGNEVGRIYGRKQGHEEGYAEALADMLKYLNTMKLRLDRTVEYKNTWQGAVTAMLAAIDREMEGDMKTLVGKALPGWDHTRIDIKYLG